MLKTAKNLCADYGTFIKSLSHDVNACLQPASRITAKIEYLSLSTLRFEITDYGVQHLSGSIGIELYEMVTTDFLPICRCIKQAIHRMNFDTRPIERHGHYLTFAEQPEDDLGCLPDHGSA